MKASFWLKLAALLLAGFTSVAVHAAQKQSRDTLLGKVTDNSYIAPDDLFRVTLPFAAYVPGKQNIIDGVLAGSLNVLFEDTEADQRFRIELSQLDAPGTAQLKQAAEARLAVYEGLLLRAYHGTPLPINFASAGDNAWAYYYRQDGDNKLSRYHLFIFFKREQHLVMLWTDFTESDVTPAFEDSVINGEHPAVQTTYTLYESLVK